MVLLISYDLNKYERPSAYAEVEAMLKKYAVSLRKPLYSQWFVETSDSVQTWHARMKDVTDDDDKWFILKVQSPNQGWFSGSIWDWLKERV